MDLTTITVMEGIFAIVFGVFVFQGIRLVYKDTFKIKNQL